MSRLHLPHTPNCVVCGPANRHGLRLNLHVVPGTGEITTAFTPELHHTGFEGILHGGVLATVLDEAMVWAAIWQSKRACVAAEMSIRFRRPAVVGAMMTCTAKVTSARRVIESAGELLDPDGQTIATGTGKYMALDEAKTQAFFATMIVDPATAPARHVLIG